jgi:acetyl-CoA carboxylase alpha subunit
VRSAAEEYHAEFAAKEATIASLTAEAESARSHMQAEIDKLRSEMEVSTHCIYAHHVHWQYVSATYEQPC